ncbi:MAG: ADP-ribosylglycohydrolase family protein [Ktedonobacterales bacterium]
MTTRQERLAGGLVGLLVGDALGVPYEFHSPENLPPAEQIEFTPPPGFMRAHAGTSPGTWSGDGAQALCLLDSLLTCGRSRQVNKASQQWGAASYIRWKTPMPSTIRLSCILRPVLAILSRALAPIKIAGLRAATPDGAAPCTG